MSHLANANTLLEVAILVNSSFPIVRELHASFEPGPEAILQQLREQQARLDSWGALIAANLREREGDETSSPLELVMVAAQMLSGSSTHLQRLAKETRRTRFWWLRNTLYTFSGIALLGSVFALGYSAMQPTVEIGIVSVLSISLGIFLPPVGWYAYFRTFRKVLDRTRVEAKALTDNILHPVEKLFLRVASELGISDLDQKVTEAQVLQELESALSSTQRAA